MSNQSTESLMIRVIIRQALQAIEHDPMELWMIAENYWSTIKTYEKE